MKKEANNTDQVAGALVALLLGLLHLVHHLVHLVHHLIGRGIKSKFRISLKQKKTHLSSNLVEVLLHGDGGLGGAKKEQQEEED